MEAGLSVFQWFQEGLAQISLVMSVDEMTGSLDRERQAGSINEDNKREGE